MKIGKSLAISENGFLFNPRTGDSFSVNELGGLIINEIKQQKTAEEIVEKICEEYEVEKYIVEKDISEYIAVLENNQIIESND